jgi:hypothetical protein
MAMSKMNKGGLGAVSTVRRLRLRLEAQIVCVEKIGIVKEEHASAMQLE